MTFTQAMILAVLQGISELFPISSLGHTVLIPPLLHWHVDERAESFLAFVVVLHLGTALALLVFYRSTWVRIVRAFVGSIVRGRFSGERDEKLAWLLVIGTIPVGILGVLFQQSVRGLFASPIPVTIFLMVNAFIMFAGEALRRRQKKRTEGAKPIEAMSWLQAAGVGVAQSLALLPGISRSGSSIVAGLLFDLDHEDAANYSFLLATPVILLASLLEIPTLFKPGVTIGPVESIGGCLVSGITAYASVAFLTRYFQHNDLRPFGWYCLIAGAAALILFSTKVIVPS
jgi:undecaprenyl-diphosphatase